jgi:DNA-binding CsgD family transcriptional regulator/tetratricopeptide (TPR) repeat protein
MHTRLTSAHLVGRVAELAELELALAQAGQGRPSLVLLAGDSGIGKTRLLADFERRLGDEDKAAATVLRGEAVQTGDGELPYGPLLGALRPLVRERHEVLSELAPGSRAQLAALLPGLDEGATRPERDDPSAQVRLFEALLELLDRLSARGPLVLILEDMHWADRSTRAFVAYLARGLREERVLALLSYRSDELHRRHPLRALLAELERSERVRRLALEPFDRQELVEALTDILGAQPSPELLARVHARAEGNPLYTEELLAASLDGRGLAPQSLRDAFMLRIERLSPSAQRAARVLAVGRALPEAMIAEVSGLAHDELQGALREAVAEQILVPSAENALSFRHELLREALYDDLLPGERSELHLALARTLEAGASPHAAGSLELSAGIAAHYSAAGDQPAALRASVVAALTARRVHAAAESARLAERALQLWPRVPDPEALTGMSHMALVLLAGRALLLSGDYARAEQLLTSVLDTLEPPHDPACHAEVLGVLAHVQWMLNRGLQGLETAKRALDSLPEGDEVGCERAELMDWLARRTFLRGRFREAGVEAEKALATAQAAGDPASEAGALNTLGMAQVMLGDVESGTARLREAIALCERENDLDGAAYGYANLADLLAVAGRTAEGLQTARDGLRAVPRHVRASHDWMTMSISELAFMTGDWDTARTHLGPPPAELDGVRLINRLLREAELALGEGDDDRAHGALERALPLVAQSSEPQWIASFGALMAELRRRERDLPAAREAVGHALDRIELCTDDIGRIARVSAAGVRVEADIAQRARDLAERRDEREAVTRGRLHLSRLRAAATEGGPVEKAWLASGAAELSRARGRGDVALWTKAAVAWNAVERPYEEALMRWRGAEAAAAAGERGVAAGLIAEALATAQRLESRWLGGELRALAQRARVRLDGAEAEVSGEPVDATPQDPFGLTPREREVLALIAQGATNRQIGAALFMAEKTASVHVSRILAKLGVASRTQAAAVAHRQGWVSPDRGAATPR